MLLGAALVPVGCSESPDAMAVRRCETWIETHLGYRSRFDVVHRELTRLTDLAILRVDFRGENTFGVSVDGLALCIFDRRDGRIGRFRPELSSVSNAASSAAAE